MRYVDVQWLHCNTDYPIRLVSEIGLDGLEKRKIEFWSDGRVGYASRLGASRDTALGETPAPAIEEINSKGEFRAKQMDASAFQELWDRHVDGRACRVECSVTLLTATQGGRTSPFPPGALSGDRYRPHLVVGGPSQRHATLADNNRVLEEYIGVAFHAGPEMAHFGIQMVVTLTAIYSPHPMYEKLKPGVTFAVREGPQVVGYGTVLRWHE